MLCFCGYVSPAFRNLVDIQNILRYIDLGFIKIEITSVVYITGKDVDTFILPSIF